MFYGSSKAPVETIYILTFEVNKYISAARCGGFRYRLVLRLITYMFNLSNHHLPCVLFDQWMVNVEVHWTLRNWRY